MRLLTPSVRVYRLSLESLRLVSCRLNLCCALHQWPVFPPPCSAMNKADAAIFELRARAAQNPDDRVGLRPDLSCATHQGPLRAESDHGTVRCRFSMSTPCQRTYVSFRRSISTDAGECQSASGVKIWEFKGLLPMCLKILSYWNRS